MSRQFFFKYTSTFLRDHNKLSKFLYLPSYRALSTFLNLAYQESRSGSVAWLQRPIGRIREVYRSDSHREPALNSQNKLHQERIHDNEFIWFGLLVQFTHLKSSSYKQGTKTLESTLG